MGVRESKRSIRERVEKLSPSAVAEDDGGISLFSASTKKRQRRSTPEKEQGADGKEFAKSEDQEISDRIKPEHANGSTFASGEASFRALGLNQWLSSNVVAMGISKPTPVQRGCIPAILAGRDVIGTAQTGTGKTAAFALPILQLLGNDPYGVFCLCLTPTRELAAQIADQFDAFSAGMTLRCQVIVGGEDIRTQGAALVSRPHVVIATPGRLMEHFMYDDSLAKAFAKLRCLVLDEVRFPVALLSPFVQFIANSSLPSHNTIVRMNRQIGFLILASKQNFELSCIIYRR
jgi:ATP-dependent helicase YprA (DUF1998 family)